MAVPAIVGVGMNMPVVMVVVPMFVAMFVPMMVVMGMDFAINEVEMFFLANQLNRNGIVGLAASTSSTHKDRDFDLKVNYNFPDTSARIAAH
jgi:hypothetical protein